MNDKMISEFEAWYETNSMPNGSDWFRLDSDGDYDMPHTQTAWEAWQAALAQQASEDESIAQYLYKLLDDIDTSGDIAKGDDQAYRQMVERIQGKKSNVVDTCDGYKVVFKLPLAQQASELTGMEAQKTMFLMLEAIMDKLERQAAPVAWLSMINEAGNQFITKQFKEPL